MLGWLFGGFVRDLERTYKDALQSTGREVDRLFDKNISPLADKLDYVAKRIDQVEELEDKVKQDIESLLNQTDGQIKDHLQIINDLRENSLKDIRETLGETNFYLENRIDQITLIVMESLTGAQNLSDRIFEQVNDLEEKTFASGMDYAPIRDLLRDREWKKADETTRNLMLKLSNRNQEGWLDKGDIEKLPWQDLRILDRLWIESSDGKFGFSIQKNIWQSIEVANQNDFEVEKTLGDRVGWRVNNCWIDYESLTFNITAPPGHLPSTSHLLCIDRGKVEDRMRFMFRKRKEL